MLLLQVVEEGRMVKIEVGRGFVDENNSLTSAITRNNLRLSQVRLSGSQ